MKKLKVLCICAVGVNRSKYLAQYLRRKGYSTRYGGIAYRWEEGANPLKPKYIDWADIIILVRKRLKPILMKKFKPKGKKIVVLDVTDSKRLIPKEVSHLKELDYKEFQKKWTRPQLRKAIEPHLPLETSKDFWQSWKNKTSIEKQAIEAVKKARKKIINSVPKKALVAIYIKGSFTRREMKQGSDIDIVPIVTKMEYQPAVFGTNSREVNPCIIVPLSIEEFKRNKLLSKSKRNPDLRAKPDRFLKKLGETKLIYGKPLNPKKYPIRSDKKAFNDEIKLVKEGYVHFYEIKNIPFEPLLKEIFWLTELEQNVKGIKPEHSFKSIAKSVKNKSHPIHIALKLRKKPNKQKEKELIKKLKKHLANLKKQSSKSL